MNPYTHLVIANKMEAHLHPDHLGDYYLGAVIPDIRYYCNLPREQTHIPQEEIAKFTDRYPQLKSFITGYMTHCKADKHIDLARLTLHRFPFSLLNGKLSIGYVLVLTEYYYLETNTLSDIRVSESSNAMLNDLGINEKDVAMFAQKVNNFLAMPSFNLGLSTLQHLGILSKSNIEKRLKTAQMLDNNVTLRKLLFAGIDTTKFEQQLLPTMLSS